MRCVRALLLTAIVAVLFADEAVAKTYGVRPAGREGHRYVFPLTTLKGRASDAVSARVLVGSSRRPLLRSATIRRAIRRGSLALTVRGTRDRRVRLMVRMDERRPNRPPDLAATAAPGSATLSWGAARDDVGVAAYRIARDGKTVATVGGSARSWTQDGLQPGRVYRYSVRAIDRTHKRSAAATTSVTTSTSAAALAPAAVVSPSGEPAPATDLAGWRLTFSDDFVSNVPLGSFPAAVSSRWQTYDEGSPDTSGQGTHSPSRVLSVHDGMLDWSMHSEGGRPLVAAALPRMPGQRYGRYAVRFRSDSLPGYKVAWLLWPDSGNWPHDGEIDFPEGELDSTFCGFVHHAGATTGTDQDAFCNLGAFATWHTAIIEWTAGQVSFILDGQVVARTTQRVPDASMHWVLMTETSGMATPSPLTSGHVLVDWVAAWSPT